MTGINGFIGFAKSQRGTSDIGLTQSDDKIVLTEDFLNLLKDYLDSLSDSEKKDNGIQSFNYKWFKTNTIENAWAAYAPDTSEGAIDYYTTVNGMLTNIDYQFPTFTRFSTDFQTGLEVGYPPDTLVFQCDTSGFKLAAWSYESMTKGLDSVYPCLLYSYNTYTKQNAFNFGCMDALGVEVMTNINPKAWFTYVYKSGEPMTLSAVNKAMGVNSIRGSAFTNYNCGEEDNYIPYVATTDGRWMRAFPTTTDAHAFYSYYHSLGCHLPDEPYEGGNVTIINGDVIYGGSDIGGTDPINPDGPGGENPSGGVTGWLSMIYDKLCEIKNQLIVNNVLTGLDLLDDLFNNYIRAAGETVSAVTETASGKFPFCIPAVIAGALVLTNSVGNINVSDLPPGSKYKVIEPETGAVVSTEITPETGGGGGSHEDGGDDYPVSVSGLCIAPVFEVPLEFKSLGVSYTVELDFSQQWWQGCRKVIWYFMLFQAFFNLLFLTLKITQQGGD